MERFIERWRGKGNENKDTQKFWLEFLYDVLKVDRPTEVIEFQKSVELAHKSFIDAYIPSTRVLIEQKSRDVNLDRAARQSDGSELTPFEQGKRYSDWLPDSERARCIIVCNFQEFRIHDMQQPKDPPEVIRLEDLERDWQKFMFMVDPQAIARHEEEISIKAGALVRKLKQSLISDNWKRYATADTDEAIRRRQRSLTVFCVRVVFLLYAEDAGLFEKSLFHDYLKPRAIMAPDALRNLFAVLNQRQDERASNLNINLRDFPYVNGGLFKDQNIEIPQLDGEPLEIILREMSEGFDWSKISPTIFGSIFERVLEDERDSGGMHYTTVENIHKVIDPLFLDELKAKLDDIFATSNGAERAQKLLKFQNKLASLRFLDPACGSGNFLTESFRSLRTLENRILRELSRQPMPHKLETKVSISQFHGIEVNDFAAAVARTALWIADNQMWKEAREITNEAPLPLKDYDHIKEGSAMHALEGLAWGLPGWKIHHEDMLYIMGNPPFLGYSQQNTGQKEDVRKLIGSGKVDYVACWFAIASEYVQDKMTKAAFVATNSITQGEQVAAIFKPLYERWKIEIDFAHQSFVWDSELKDNIAHVHCVVIGFSTTPPKLRKLYAPDGSFVEVEHINFYLRPEPNYFIEARKAPICEYAPVMITGNMPRDDGGLILTADERDELLRREPRAEKFIRRYMGAEEFINNIPRYCLWLVNATPGELYSMRAVMKRVKAVKKFRLASKREATRRSADTSWLFAEIRQPAGNYIAIPKTSSETRKYVPVDWLDASIIPGDALKVIPGATLYHFGVLTSRVHMAWMRAVAGRLKSDYRYSNTVVYNNFPWPQASTRHRAKIEQTAQKILDARAKYSDSSFASMYSDTMPSELRKAHEVNDAAVCRAYGWDKDISEEDIVTELVKMYRSMVK